ncbi:MAG TPA: pentapeptide repeat-containing protein, partial [Coleofasciculaceae cyanobacterium]
AELEGANLEGANFAEACLVGTSQAEVFPPPQQVKIPLKIAEIEQTSRQE